MSSVADQIEMRNAKRMTVCKRAYAPRAYILSDPQSVKDAVAEPKTEQIEFLKECFLVERDVPVLLLAVRHAARRAEDLEAEIRKLVAHHNIVGRDCTLPIKYWDEFVADAWDEIPITDELQRVLDDRESSDIESGLGSGKAKDVDGQLKMDLGNKTIGDIPKDEQAEGGPVTTMKLVETPEEPPAEVALIGMTEDTVDAEVVEKTHIQLTPICQLINQAALALGREPIPKEVFDNLRDEYQGRVPFFEEFDLMIDKAGADWRLTFDKCIELERRMMHLIAGTNYHEWDTDGKDQRICTICYEYFVEAPSETPSPEPPTKGKPGRKPGSKNKPKE